MRYLSESKALILHIPRTGGTWVEKAIQLCNIESSRWVSKQPNNLPKKHCLLPHIARRHVSDIDFVAAFVRHPIPYYESVWKWMSKTTRSHILRKRWTWHPHKCAIDVFKKNKDFNEWVYNMSEKHPGWYSRMVKMYVGPQGGEFCGYIGRTESLVDDFLELLTGLGYKQHMAIENEIRAMAVPNSIEAKINWCGELKGKVLEQEHQVIERFYRGENLHRRCYTL